MSILWASFIGKVVGHYRACWSFPVATASGKVVGTFAMHYNEPREASVRDPDFVATIARAAAVVMDAPPGVQ